MISGIFITTITLLLLSGVIMLLGSIAKFGSYAATKGRIVKWLDCPPCLDLGREMEAVNPNMPIAAVITYQVNRETFRLTAKMNKELLKAKKKKMRHVQVFYNPYEPAKARLQEGSPLLGLLLIMVSLSAIFLHLVL